MYRYTHIFPQVLAHLSHLSYPEIFLAILASGHPLPVPEGVVFFLLGILASQGAHALWGMFIVSSLAAFIYDITLYSLSYAGSRLVTKLTKHTASWMHWYSGKKDHEMFLLTFVSHFVPGWRMANPIIAAGLGVPPKRFVLYSILPVVVYPAVYILAGFFLSHFSLY